MALKLFDLDYDLQADSTTNDFKELYNVDAINQSIDIWLTTPYRIGEGFTNNLLSLVFSDINLKTEDDIRNEILDEMENNYQFLEVQNLRIESDPKNRRIYVSLDWMVKTYEVSGNYSRYWSL